MTQQVIRVLIAEDMHMIRGALTALLKLEPDMEVVAELDRGDTILAAALAARPDVAVLDIGLPGIDGLTAAAELHEALPECRALVLTGLAERARAFDGAVTAGPTADGTFRLLVELPVEEP